MMAIDRNGEEGDPWLEGQNATPQAASADELDLDAGSEQLPWLESDEDYEQGGTDTARIAAIAIIGLLAIGLVVGGLWWVTQDRRDSALLADGSTIEAPEDPYKTRPEEPGGKKFAGTGDSSFAVAEGQSREGQLATTPVPVPAKTVAVEGQVEEDAAPAGAVGVQVGAYANKATAEAGWSRLVGQYEDLQGLRHRIVEGQADIGTVYRLQALTPDVSSANSLCSRLKAAGGACQVKR